MHFCKSQELQLEAPSQHAGDLSSHVGETLTLDRESVAFKSSRFSTKSTRALSAGLSGIPYRQELSYDAEPLRSLCSNTSAIKARLDNYTAAPSLPYSDGHDRSRTTGLRLLEHSGGRFYETPQHGQFEATVLSATCPCCPERPIRSSEDTVRVNTKSVLSVADLAIKHWLKRNEPTGNFYSGQITIVGDVTGRGDLEYVGTGAKTTEERAGSDQGANTSAQSVVTAPGDDSMTDQEIERNSQQRAMANLRNTAITMARFVLTSPTHDDWDDQGGLYVSEDDA